MKEREIGQLGVHITECLKKFREKKGMSQAQFASEIGVSTTAYGNLERGDTRIFNKQFYKIVERFNENPLNLLFSSREPYAGSGVLESPATRYGENPLPDWSNPDALQDSIIEGTGTKDDWIRRLSNNIDNQNLLISRLKTDLQNLRNENRELKRQIDSQKDKSKKTK